MGLEMTDIVIIFDIGVIDLVKRDIWIFFNIKTKGSSTRSPKTTDEERQIRRKCALSSRFNQDHPAKRNENSSD